MRILVIGAGALGSLVGGILSANHEVTILGRPEQAWVLEHKGLRIEGLTQGDFHPRAIAGIPRDGNFDLIIMCVKAYNTEMTLEPISHLFRPGTSILSLQNGLDNEERILRFLQKRSLPGEVIGGITCHGVTYKGPGLVRHAGTGDTIIGHFGSVGIDMDADKKVQEVALAFKEAGLELQTTSSIVREIWAKTIINSAINPLTAIVGERNGVILKNPDLNRMARDLVIEGVKVANAHGIDLTEDEMLDRTLKVAERTQNNISSMFQDIKRKRRTEVDSINGAICMKAEEVDMDAPLNRTMLHLIKGLEERSLDQGPPRRTYQPSVPG